VLAFLILAIMLNKLFPESKSYYYPMWWIIGVFLYFGKNYLMKSLLFTLALLILYLFSDRENIHVAILQLLVLYTIFLTALKYEVGTCRFLSKISSFSYSLYLFHFPIFLLIYSCFSYFHQTIQPTLAERSIVSVVASISAFYFSKVIGARAENVIFFKKLITSSYSKVVRN
jgi:peptidoglycan/LPS O-acetylase OafA/YrhL